MLFQHKGVSRLDPTHQTEVYLYHHACLQSSASNLLLGGLQGHGCVSQGLHEPWANMKQRSLLGTLGLVNWEAGSEKD